jgi:hypothetical protein
MDQIIDWEKDEFKIVYSDIFYYFRQSVVTIYKKRAGTWSMAIADMSPSILVRCKFPKAICHAASLTTEDKQSRMVKNGKIEVVRDLFVPPPKPQLYIPK